MLVACRLAGLSALEAHYPSLKARTQSGIEVVRIAMTTAVFMRYVPIERGEALARTRSPYVADPAKPWPPGQPQ